MGEIKTDAPFKLDGITASIDISALSKNPISNFIFGGFIEHIGGLITRSLWSEVLDDRKFFRAVNSTPLPEPVGPAARQGKENRWEPLGPESSITMDTAAPYVGEQSPRVSLSESVARGLCQRGLALDKKCYVGRVVIAAEPGSCVTVTLSWGPSPAERESVLIDASPDWATVPLSFSCGAKTADGCLEISGLGSGNFRIGAVSLMPSDNVKGFRADTLEILKEMNCGILRMPGGNFISGYDWKDTIGDPDRRPPILDQVWGAVQQNDVGVDELIWMCRYIGAEPYWCVNTGFGEPRSGGELVEYANGATNTEWGARRAANGHPEPYGIKYWNIGNEMYGHWQLGHMSPEHYAIKHRLFAKAMRRVDPSIYIVAPGGFVDEMTTGQGIMVDSGSRLVDFGSERDWAGGMFSRCMGSFDALATHAYQPENKHFNHETGKNEDIKQSLAEWARAPADRVATMADCWEEYKKRFPTLRDGSVKVFFDEWAYRFIQDYKSCLAAARTLHEFFRHTDFIDMAGYTMGTAWIDCDRLNSCVSASGLLFQLYNRHFGRIPVRVSGNSPVPPPQFPLGGNQPKVNTGSDTWPLDVSAALTADSKYLTVAVVNASESARSLGVCLAGAHFAAKGRAWKLEAPGLEAMNHAGKEPGVRIRESEFDATVGELEIGAFGIELYRYALQ
jgi:alpha-N-arabinofuranosidase